MNEEIRKDILDVLDKSVVALKDHDSRTLREMSNHTIHNSSIFQDKDSINIAVVIYALSKFVERMRDGQELIEKLKKAKERLEDRDVVEYDKALGEMINIISEVDKKINFYVKHIINQAGIKKGSKVYEHGVSLARAAEIFNITQWELMRYLGQTNIPDRFTEPVQVQDRIEYTRRLFGL